MAALSDLRRVGTLARQNANAVAITGGSIAGIADLAVADGGTGASTQEGARANLGMGTAATANIGTSGATIPLLNAANEWGAPQAFAAGFLWGNNLYGPSTAFAATIGANPAASITAGGYLQLYGSTHGSGPLAIVGAGAGSLSVGVSALTYNTNTVLHTGNIGGTTITWGAVQTFSAQPVLNAGARVTQGGVNIDTVGSAGVGFFGTQTNHPLAIRTNDTEVARFLAGGGLDVVSGSLLSPIRRVTGVSGVLTRAAHANRQIEITGGITINDSVFNAGDRVAVYNNSGSSQTITQGAGVTMRLGATATTGSRTILLRGEATLYFPTSSECVVSGGVT